MYLTKHAKDINGIINYMVYSDVFECPSCQNEILFLNPSCEQEVASGRLLICQSCGTENPKTKLNRVYETIFDEIISDTIKLAKPCQFVSPNGVRLYMPEVFLRLF